MGALTRLVAYIIPLVVLVLAVTIFYGESGMIEEVKQSANTLTDAITIEVGLEEVGSTEVDISKEHKDAIENLSEAIEKLKGSTNCFYQTKALPDLGESGTRLSFNSDESNSYLTVYGGEAGKQIVSEYSEVFEDVSLCVVAGENNEAVNFYSYYFSSSPTKDLEEKYYSEVSRIDIYYSTENYNGNKIEVADFGSEPVNDQSDNFESNGWLYTPGDGVICFFPSNYNNNADEDGIENDYFLALETGNGNGNRQICILD